MALRSELSELLAGFEKRMKFINIVRCLLDYKYPDHIREMIPDKRILDNMIVAVLVFIISIIKLNAGRKKSKRKVKYVPYKENRKH